MHTPPAEPSDSDEFTTFMRAYQDMVFSNASRLAGDDALAQDISQQVFVKAYEHFSHLRGSPAAGGWLKTVTTNLTLNQLTRYRYRWRFFSELPAADSDARSSPELEIPVPDTLLAELSSEQRRERVDRALQELPRHQRLPLVLYHFDDLSYESIAARLKISLSKVKTDIRRGRAALLLLLTTSGIARSDFDE